MEYLRIAREAMLGVRDENNNRVNSDGNRSLVHTLLTSLKRKHMGESDAENESDTSSMTDDSSRTKRPNNVSAMNLRSNCNGECGLVQFGLPHTHHRRKHRPQPKPTPETVQMHITQKSSNTNLKSEITLKKSAKTSIEISNKAASNSVKSFSSDLNHNFVDTNKSKSTVVDETSFKKNDSFLQCTRIHDRYQEYLNLSQEEKDQYKTDYTYAHSYSYSSFVPLKDRFAWIVPNMSRPSVHYTRTGSDAFLDKEAVTRKILGNTPVKQLNQSFTTSTITEVSNAHSKQISTKTLRSAKNNQEHLMHSTPIKTRTGVHQLTRKFDYSDDDEEVEMEYSRVQKEVKSKQNGVKRNITNFPSDEAQLSEEDEDITIIRRINRYVITTVRNILGKKSDENDDETDTVQNQYSNRHRQIITKPQSSSKSESKRNRCLLWSFLLLFPILLSTGLFYYYNGNNFNNLLENLSKPNINNLIKQLKFGPASSFNSIHDVSQFNIELQSLKDEIRLMRDQYNSDPSASFDSINKHEAPDKDNVPDGPSFDELLDRIAKLELKISNCCNQTNITDVIETEVKSILDTKLYHFQEQYDKQLEKEVDKIKNQLISLVRTQIANHTVNFQENGSFDSDQIEIMIKNAISKYDADKTGEADYALESSGAWIVSTRCSETYELYTASYKLLGLTLWRSRNTARVVIQSGVVPGECWCFKGAEGRIAIHLSSRIIPTAFSYEHIPKSLSRDGHIQSAPSKFIVYGLKTEDDIEPESLGEYKYSIDSDDPLQRFEVQDQQTALHTFRYIEIAVKSNHGHPEYTCLYRFRVHGTPVFDENL